MSRAFARAAHRISIALSLVVGCPGAAVSWAQEQIHFNPDTDPSRIQWFRVDDLLGPAPDVRGRRYGAVLKTQTNEYWRLMTAGYRKRAARDGVKLDIQAARSETDPNRQLAIMETMIGGFYQGLLISPQSDSNLQPAIEDAAIANLPLVDVDGAVVDSVEHFVGAMNRDMGVAVADWFVKAYPKGGKVAVIRGLPGVFSSVQRTAGFVETLVASRSYSVVAMEFGDWSEAKAFELTVSILKRSPDLIGIYCNNDVMALGAVAAVKSLGLLEQVKVFGTDGTQGAYRSIERGEMAGTVDIFPALVGEIGLDTLERLSVGQTIPRVVVTPQALITKDNIARYQGAIDIREVLLKDLRLKP